MSLLLIHADDMLNTTHNTSLMSGKSIRYCQNRSATDMFFFCRANQYFSGSISADYRNQISSSPQRCDIGCHIASTAHRYALFSHRDHRYWRLWRDALNIAKQKTVKH